MADYAPAKDTPKLSPNDQVVMDAFTHFGVDLLQHAQIKEYFLTTREVVDSKSEKTMLSRVLTKLTTSKQHARLLTSAKVSTDYTTP